MLIEQEQVMKRVSLVQVGFGTVGGALIELVIQHRARWREVLGLEITVAALAGRSGVTVAGDAQSLPDDVLLAAVEGRRSGARVSAPDGPGLAEVLPAIADAGPFILLDAAAGDQTADADVQALALGGGVVLSNKAPLALPASDARTAALWGQSGPTGGLRYEATCGAGLPVISTLRSLLDTGDEVLEISGTLSGTFGAIFSAVGSGVPFSQAVRDARAQGYTEPDPRDDLSGLDVARKGLILSRTIGNMIDLDQISVHSLVPRHLEDVSIDEFLDRLRDQDYAIGRQAEESLLTDTALKYVMHWNAGDGVTVGLRQVPRATVLGALQGPENIVSFRTKRYDQYPCVMSGPGAGAAVTAAGMLADVLALAARLEA
jgi:homoserine dehydrogenase